jgi:DNA excision repair protein ERCC-4
MPRTATKAEPIPVLIDTREQRPWEFDAELFATERATLATGDYTIAGLEEQLCLERKSLGDFVQTVISDWIRFRKELYRLAAFDVAAVVVEADLPDVLNGLYESTAAPASVLGRANGIFLDHGIPVLFWGSRPSCTAMAERFLIQAHKKLGGGR